MVSSLFAQKLLKSVPLERVPPMGVAEEEAVTTEILSSVVRME